MTQAGSHGSRGFTLIELLMTMTIIAVLAALVLPKFTNDNRLRLHAASSVLTSDIELAQVMTISHPNQPVIVKFDPKNRIYWLAYADDPETPMPRNDTSDPYLITLGQGRAANATDLHMHLNDIQDKTLRFNALGGLVDFSSQPEIYFHVTGKKGDVKPGITLVISPMTGTVTEIGDSILVTDLDLAEGQ